MGHLHCVGLLPDTLDLMSDEARGGHPPVPAPFPSGRGFDLVPHSGALCPSDRRHHLRPGNLSLLYPWNERRVRVIGATEED